MTFQYDLENDAKYPYGTLGVQRHRFRQNAEGEMYLHVYTNQMRWDVGLNRIAFEALKNLSSEAWKLTSHIVFENKPRNHAEPWIWSQVLDYIEHEGTNRLRLGTTDLGEPDSQKDYYVIALGVKQEAIGPDSLFGTKVRLKGRFALRDYLKDNFGIPTGASFNPGLQRISDWSTLHGFALKVFEGDEYELEHLSP